jgi:two-component system, NtrC family, sensor kinase
MKMSYPATKTTPKNSSRYPGIPQERRSRYSSTKNNDFFHLMAENSCDIIFRAHYLPTFGFDYVSQSSTHITGYTPEEFYADPYLAKKCIHPEDLQLLIDPTKPGAPPTYEPTIIRWTCKDGHIIWTEHIVTINRNKYGEPENCQIIARDVTERKKTEQALRESQQFASSLLENAPHATVVINPDTSIRYVNPAWVQLNGWSLPEVVGMKAPYPWWPEELKDAFLEGFLQAMKQGSGKGEVIAVKKNGEKYWIDMNWAPVTHDGELQYLLINSVDTTERKLAEEKRQTILKTALDGFCIINLEGKFLEVNDSYCRMTGYTQEELLKMSIKDIEASQNPQQISQRTKKIVEQGSDRFETQHKRKDGRIIDIEISAKYTDTGDGQLFVFIRDITEHKAAEKTIQESEEKFSKAFHSSPATIAITTLKESKYIEVNDSYIRSTGYTSKELIGRSSTDVNIWAKPEDRAKLFKILKKQGRVSNEEFDFRMKSGEIRTWLFSAEHINIAGEPCLIGVAIDITERKQAQEQLRMLSSVTQQVSDSIIVTDPKMRITYMNRAAQDLFGYTIDEARGKNLAMFNKNPITEKTSREINETVTAGKVWSGTLTKKRKDGRTIICDCRLSPLYDKEGKISSYIDVQCDVTERKEVEAKLHAQRQLIEGILATMPEGVLVIGGNDRVILANHSAHHIFHLRHNAIKNRLLKDIIPVDQLLNLYNGVKLGKQEDNTLEFRYRVHNIDKIFVCGAIKMDEERTLLTFTDVSRERDEKEKLYLTDRLASLGEMAAGLAHELNNPLTGILSLSQLLVESDIPPEPKEDLQCIHSEAKRAANIVKNVLLFTRNNNFEHGQASVNEVVRDVLRLREYEEKANNINVVTNLQESLPDIQVDEFQLQQVFLNIILNAEAAIKDANRPGLLTVTTEGVNHHVNIMFGDNGCGIKKNVLPRIFDPFFTTKDIGKGTGLGLSICYGIVSKHGGKISVKTQVNKGTTFTIRLPVAP